MSIFAAETQATSGKAVDLSSTDWTNTAGAARGILVGTAGNIVGRLEADTADVTYPVPAGMLGLKFITIRKTGTTAGSIVALF